MLTVINQLCYAQEQEGGNQQPSMDVQCMCNYVLNRYVFKDPKDLLRIFRTTDKLPCEMFLHDCLFNKPLCETITDLRSDDPDKKKHAQETIACMQKELKKRIAIFTKFVKTKNEENRSKSMFWLKAGLGSLAGSFALASYSSSNFTSDLCVLLCLSGSAMCVGSCVLYFLPYSSGASGLIVEFGYRKIKKLSGLLDKLVAHKG